MCLAKAIRGFPTVGCESRRTRTKPPVPPPQHGGPRQTDRRGAPGPRAGAGGSAGSKNLQWTRLSVLPQFCTLLWKIYPTYGHSTCMCLHRPMLQEANFFSWGGKSYLRVSHDFAACSNLNKIPRFQFYWKVCLAQASQSVSQPVSE